MSAPVLPIDFDALNVTMDMESCEAFSKRMVLTPMQWSKIYSWMFDPNGTPSKALSEGYLNPGGSGTVDTTTTDPTTTNTKLAAPILISASTNVSGGIVIKWATVTGATNYELWRSSTSTDPTDTSKWAKVATVTVIQYTDALSDKILVGASYNYFVRATNTTGSSAASNVKTGSALAKELPDHTEPVTKTITATEVTLEWSIPSNTTYAYIKVWGPGGNSGASCLEQYFLFPLMQEAGLTDENGNQSHWTPARMTIVHGGAGGGGGYACAKVNVSSLWGKKIIAKCGANDGSGLITTRESVVTVNGVPVAMATGGGDGRDCKITYAMISPYSDNLGQGYTGTIFDKDWTSQGFYPLLIEGYPRTYGGEGGSGGTGTVYTTATVEEFAKESGSPGEAGQYWHAGMILVSKVTNPHPGKPGNSTDPDCNGGWGATSYMHGVKVCGDFGYAAVIFQ